MSYPEFMRWMAYFTIQDETEHNKSWGRNKSDWLAAQLVWTMRLVMGGKDAAGELKDHLMEFQAPSEQKAVKPSSVMDLRAKLLAWAQLNRATDLRGTENVNRNADGKTDGR
jgi:hypothetical protein